MEDSMLFNGLFTPSIDSSSGSIFPSPHVQNVGSTVVVHQPNQPIVLQNFFHMPISTTLLAKRFGAYSLYLDTLVIAMRAQIFTSPVGTVTPLINALLHNQPLDGLVSGINTVTIATCRIPDFSNMDNIRDSGIGYIQLPGSLDELLLYIPDSSHFTEYGRELLSIGSILQENTQVNFFFNTWKPFGMQLDFHFILLFLLRPVYLATAINLNGFLSPSPSIFPSGPLFHPIYSSRLGTPATLLSMASTSTNSTMNTSSTTVASNFSRALTENEVADSRYEAKKKGVVAQVKNWRAMKNVLEKLSIAPDEDMSAVLAVFGWSAITFKHKSLWYEWALEAAQKTWKGGPERTPVNHEFSQEYKQWRGIVYLFKSNGAIDRNYIPKATSVDLDERWAAEVTQTKMDSMRATISAHLV